MNDKTPKTYLRILNWDKYQHYKDRNPPWVKLHQNLMTSEEWVSGSDSQKVLLVAMMLLAARHDNCIPNQPDYIRRVAYLDGDPDINWLIEIEFCELAGEQIDRESPWPSRHIPVKMREEILAAQSTCVQCGSETHLEIDHIVPVSKGGKSEKSNLQVLCRSCNRRKRVSVASATQPTAQRRIETEKRREEKKEGARAPKNVLGKNKVNGSHNELINAWERTRLAMATKGIQHIDNTPTDFERWVASGELTIDQARKAGASI